MGKLFCSHLYSDIKVNIWKCEVTVIRTLKRMEVAISEVKL